MKHFVAITLLALASVAAQASGDIHETNKSIAVEAGRTVGQVKTTNGQVRLKERVTAGDVNSTNGGITIGEGSRVEHVGTTNGNIALHRGVQARAAHSTNGSINIDENARLAGDAQTTNGSVIIKRDARVGGNVKTTNGRIALERAHVDGRLSTNNGDIEVGANSHVGQGIRIGKSGGRLFNLFGNGNRPPKVVVGPHAVVNGPLVFEREVELYVSDTAKIGPVTGATPVKFKGERP
jgi:hypothetical protein